MRHLELETFQVASDVHRRGQDGDKEKIPTKEAIAISGVDPMAVRGPACDPGTGVLAGRMRRGTIICWVDDGDHGRAALDVAAELSDRLGLRLVLAHVVDGVGAPAGRDAPESAARKRERERATRLVERLAAEHELSGRAELRSAVGDPVTLLGQMAAEEAADLIVIGARTRGLRRSPESRLAQQLEVATEVPVLITGAQSQPGSPVTRRTAR